MKKQNAFISDVILACKTIIDDTHENLEELLLIGRGGYMSDHIEVTDQNFQETVLESSIPVLVDYWAEWCAPCRMVGPIVEKIAEEYEGRIKVAKMDVDANPETPVKYEISGIPTLILFKDGRVAEKIVGAVPKSKIEAVINKVL